MANYHLCFLIVLLTVCVCEIYGHGKMTDPLNRSSLGTSGKYPQAEPNYEDNENFCGGRTVQHGANGGKCGPCGDNYQDPVPRKNENGGLYGIGIIVKEYKAGEKIKVVVDLTANHLGHFEFNICDLKNEKDVETEECFNEHRLKVVDKNGEIGDKYHPGSIGGLHEVEVHLPADFKCKHCVLRWHYRTGNNWGKCENGRHGQGCGDMETFRSCSDIAIV